MSQDEFIVQPVMIAETARRATREAARANFLKEAKHIQLRALRGDTAVRRLGPIVFFCAHLDAWMLDPEDGYARCVMSQGQKLPLGIVDYGMRFGVKWNADYRIENGQFIVGQFGRGAMCIVEGYPVHEIAQITSAVVPN